MSTTPHHSLRTVHQQQTEAGVGRVKLSCGQQMQLEQPQSCTRRSCRQLVAAYSRRLSVCQQELSACRQLRERQLACLLSSLLWLEARLRREQREIRELLAAKDNIINEQKLELEKLRAERLEAARRRLERPAAAAAAVLGSGGVGATPLSNTAHLLESVSPPVTDLPRELLLDKPDLITSLGIREEQRGEGSDTSDCERGATVSQQQRRDSSERSATVSQQQRRDSNERDATVSQQQRRDSSERSATVSQQQRRDITERSATVSQQQRRDSTERSATVSQQQRRDSTERDATVSQQRRNSTERDATVSLQQRRDSTERGASRVGHPPPPSPPPQLYSPISNDAVTSLETSPTKEVVGGEEGEERRLERGTADFRDTPVLQCVNQILLKDQQEEETEDEDFLLRSRRRSCGRGSTGGGQQQQRDSQHRVAALSRWNHYDEEEEEEEEDLLGQTAGGLMEKETDAEDRNCSVEQSELRTEAGPTTPPLHPALPPKPKRLLEKRSSSEIPESAADSVRPPELQMSPPVKVSSSSQRTLSPSQCPRAVSDSVTNPFASSLNSPELYQTSHSSPPITPAAFHPSPGVTPSPPLRVVTPQFHNPPPLLPLPPPPSSPLHQPLPPLPLTIVEQESKDDELYVISNSALDDEIVKQLRGRTLDVSELQQRLKAAAAAGAGRGGDQQQQGRHLEAVQQSQQQHCQRQSSSAETYPAAGGGVLSELSDYQSVPSVKVTPNYPNRHYSPSSVKVTANSPNSSHYSPSSVKVTSNNPSCHYSPSSVKVTANSPNSSHYSPSSVKVTANSPNSSHYSPSSVKVTANNPNSSHYSPSSVKVTATSHCYHQPPPHHYSPPPPVRVAPHRAADTIKTASRVATLLAAESQECSTNSPPSAVSRMVRRFEEITTPVNNRSSTEQTESPPSSSSSSSKVTASSLLPPTASYDNFLEVTGLSQKSIVTTPSRLMSNHRSVTRPKDVKLRSNRVKSSSGSGASLTAVPAAERYNNAITSPGQTPLLATTGPTVKYWTEPFL